jgi:threonine dehydrogenase-like Zn-dependent dehydrogenase
MYGAGDVHIETVPDAHLLEPTDAVVHVSRAAVCGSDLWPYKTMPPTDTGRRMGHEFIGVVEDVAADVRTIKVGDLVVMPFAYSDGTCVVCYEGLQTSCIHGGYFGTGGDADGAQTEVLRVPQADGTLVVLPVCVVDALLPDVLEGRIEPGRVFDRVTNLDGVPDGYRAMNDREAIKVMFEL